MTQETYRFAYEEAHAELNEILGKFELLQARKEQMEQVVATLRAVLAGEDGVEAVLSQSSEQAPFLVHQSVELLPEQKKEPVPEPVPVYEEQPAFVESSDPFQRRIDMALRQGLGSKVSSRNLSGLLSRA